MRTFFYEDFQKFFNISQCDKSQNTDEDGILVENIREYTKLKFPNFNSQKMASSILSIIDPKEKYCTFSDKNQKYRREISGLLYWYSKKKWLKFSRNREFLEAVTYFLSSPSILLRITKGRTSEKLVEEYKKNMIIINIQCGGENLTFESKSL